MSTSSSQPSRRSTRQSPMRKQPKMITQPGDSRRAIRRDEGADSDASFQKSKTNQKRRRPSSSSDEESDDSDSSSNNPKKPSSGVKTSKRSTAKKTKSSKGARKEPKIKVSSACDGVKLQVNLVQDSDEENMKVASKKEAVNQDEEDNDQYHPIKGYFGAPKHGDKDVRISHLSLRSPHSLLMNCFPFFTPFFRIHFIDRRSIGHISLSLVQEGRSQCRWDFESLGPSRWIQAARQVWTSRMCEKERSN